MVAKGIAYGYHGRMWEARALYGGARQLAEEIGRPDIMAAATQNLSFEVALDDPRLAVDLQREGVDLARRLGRRTLEITTLGNLSEDARRTGDWDWVLGRDQCRPDAPSRRKRHHPAPPRPADPGRVSRRAGRRRARRARDGASSEISDPDIAHRSTWTSGRSLAFGAGRWAEAAATWLEAAGIERPQPAVHPSQGGSCLRPRRRRRRRRRNARAAARPGHARPGRGCRPGGDRGGHRRVAWRSGRRRWPGTARPWRRGAASGCRGTRRSRPSRR